MPVLVLGGANSPVWFRRSAAGQAARPDHDVFTVVHTFTGTYADLVIGTNGHIDLIEPEFRRIILARQGDQDLHLVRNPDYALLYNTMGMIEWEP